MNSIWFGYYYKFVFLMITPIVLKTWLNWFREFGWLWCVDKLDALSVWSHVLVWMNYFYIIKYDNNTRKLINSLLGVTIFSPFSCTFSSISNGGMSGTSSNDGTEKSL